MPIYEYQCQDCGEIFEKIVSFSQESDISCAKCDSANVQKNISTPAASPSMNNSQMPLPTGCGASGGCPAGKGFS